MADVELFDFPNPRDRLDVGDSEAVSGVDGESERRAETRAAAQRVDGLLVARMMCVRAGVQLDRDRAEIARRANRAFVRIDEKTRANTRSVQARDSVANALLVTRDVEPTFCCDLLAPLRYEGGLMRLQLDRETQHLVGAGHLEVEHCTDFARQTADVVILDVTTIFTQVRGDAVGARVLAEPCSRYGIRLVATARLPDRRDVVDVDVKALAAHVCHPLAFRMRVKKLAVVALLAVAACHRQVRVGSALTSNTPGGATPREAVQLFMSAAKAQDIQAISNVWGTAAGPARSTMDKTELEMREIILMCYLAHDSYHVLGEAPGVNGERVLAVEVKYQDLTRSTNFYATRGPASRWYVARFDNIALQDICARSKPKKG